ncbi:ORC-CDC6 family AAA ATPase [Aidingimonas lacisalsi]|uniref:ORC-CDC6 family AAA ATPase n=1 Tax=Aidingimonas lacisalsi TaxID=2604086 RepID=UPI0011D1A418|nr:hypothetical protein [Aidingimonas lacisalsi]
MMTETSEITKLKHSLTKNRSEHLGKDVWNDFVVPRFFNRVDLTSEMPIRLEGGRGSGKTMLLRYLSYHSQFSLNRHFITDEDVSRIGLYWKADTQFLRLMTKRSIGEDTWLMLFDHYLNLKIAYEMLSSIFSLSDSHYGKVTHRQVAGTVLEGVSDFGFEKEGINDVYKEIGRRIRKTEMIIQNIKDVQSLNFLPVSFIAHLAESVLHSFPCLQGSLFSVYIDEYENLLSYQQRVINTRIKHSEPPIIYNIAIKKNGMSETSTLSHEKLENKADFSIINLDDQIEMSGFDVYVSEIFLKKLGESCPNVIESCDIDLSVCQEVDKIDARYDCKYEASCREALNRIFPGRTHYDLAEEVFNTPSFYNKMVSEIKRALEQKKCAKYHEEDFVSGDHKKASIVCASLLFRRNINPEDVAAELFRLRNGEKNKFTDKTAWEHNYFIGCYLRIVRAYKTNSTFYSGFDVYTSLSGGNVRHFLELCRTAISLVGDNDLAKDFVVSRKLQHIAARNTSEELVREIQRFTPLGNQLNNFVRGLGRVFQLCQDRESQSETEVTHFGIKDDQGVFKEEDQFFLDEAEKWGVLKAIESTKNKSLSASPTYDYILNPVYSPFFLISYRKGRKLDIDAVDFKALFQSGEAAVNSSIGKKLRLLSNSNENSSTDMQASLL